MTLILLVALAVGVVLGLSKTGIDILPPQHMQTVHAYADYVGAKAMQVKEFVVGKFESYFHKHEEKPHEGAP